MALSQTTVRVLLVEDEVLIQEVLREALQDGGYEVDFIQSALAEAYFREQLPA